MGLLKDIEDFFNRNIERKIQINVDDIELNSSQERQLEAKRLIKEGFECTCTFNMCFRGLDKYLKNTQDISEKKEFEKECIALNKKEKKLWCGKKKIEYSVVERYYVYKRKLCKKAHEFIFSSGLRREYEKYHKSEPEPVSYFVLDASYHNHIEENTREICKDTKKVYEYKVIKEK